MNELQAALRAKYGTPEKVLEALRLSPSLLATDARSDGPLLNALKRNPKMTMSRTALRAHASLTALIGPRLAADAKLPNLTGAVAGITRGNFAKSKRQIIARTKTILKGAGFAADQAGPDDVIMKVLDMVGAQGAAGGEVEGEMDPDTSEANQTRDADPGAVVDPAQVVTDPSSAVPPAAAKPKPKPGEQEEAMDEPDPEMMKALMAKCGGDEGMAKACYDICMGGATDEVVDPAATETPSTGKAVDEEAPMMKPAMDAAIKSAVAQAKADMRAEARAAQEARDFVAPYVGKLSPAFDSAEAIYEATMKAMGIATKGVHPSAYRTIIQVAAKPGSRKGLGMDEAPSARERDRQGDTSDLSRRFPHAASIQVMR